MKANKTPIRELVLTRKAEILELCSRRGARNIRLIGSVARGEETSRSDIDFMVEMEPDRSLLDRAGLQVDLHKLLGKRVDVVTERSVKERYLESMLSQAIPLS